MNEAIFSPPIQPMWASARSSKNPEITHDSVKQKLNKILATRSVPNLLFYGSAGSGKRTVVKWFVEQMYETEKMTATSVHWFDCIENSGIQYIRDTIKFISKTNIHPNSPLKFKTIVLGNADSLTIDAQSALRRCIEIHSTNTRFFFVTRNRAGLSNPILSRLGSILVIPQRAGKYLDINLNSLPWAVADLTANSSYIYMADRIDNLIISLVPGNVLPILAEAKALVASGYSGLDVVEYVRHSPRIPEDVKYRNLAMFDIIRLNLRNEEALIFTILIYSLIRQDTELEKILVM